MTLSEMIKDIDDFGALIQNDGKWAAVIGKEVLDTKKDFIYDTPEEAVIALLNK